MAIFVKTSTPGLLIDNIKKKIDGRKIDTWSVDSDNDFTHNVDQLSENESLDGVWPFKKGTSFDVLFDRLDKCIKRLCDPSLVWRTIRSELLGRDLDSKTDTDINLVAEWENQFVRSVLELDEEPKSVNLNLVGMLHKGVSLVSEVKSLVDCIAPLIAAS